MPVTEIAICPLKAGAAIGDPDSHEASVLNNVLESLRATDGVQQLHFGTQMEDPTNLVILQDWETVEHHQGFMKSEVYGPFMDRLNSILASNVQGMHVDFVPQGALSKTLSAPATEVAIFYFDGGPPSGYTDNAGKIDEALREVDGYLGCTVGITHETLEKEGVKSKAAVLVIGWQSKEHHLAMRETQVYKDNSHLWRSNAKKVSVWHVQFMQPL